jgi:hypothetical protein
VKLRVETLFRGETPAAHEQKYTGVEFLSMAESEGLLAAEKQFGVNVREEKSLTAIGSTQPVPERIG